MAAVLAAASCGLPPIDETQARGSIQRTVLENRLTDEFLKAYSFELWSSNERESTVRWPASFAADGTFHTPAPAPSPVPDGAAWSLTGPATLTLDGQVWGYDSRLECLYRGGWCISVRVDDALLAWLRRYEGWKGLNLAGEKAVSDAGLAEIAQLCQPSLIALQLEGTSVSDGGISQLTHCAALTSLDLSQTAVTDEGFALLLGLPRLAVLKAPPAVTDDGLAAIEGMPALHHLRLLDTQITDLGLGYFAGSKRLRTLDLRRTRVTNAGMERLATARSLQSLYLPAGVDGEGLRYLVRLPELARLSLTGPVTETQLRLLGRMPQLRSLRLPPGLSAQEVAVLRTRSPQIRVLVGASPEGDLD